MLSDRRWRRRSVAAQEGSGGLIRDHLSADRRIIFLLQANV